MQFSSMDRDNDLYPEISCAQDFGGGFWYNHCGCFSVNSASSDQYGFVWHFIRMSPEYSNLQTSRMWLVCG